MVYLVGTFTNSLGALAAHRRPPWAIPPGRMRTQRSRGRGRRVA